MGVHSTGFAGCREASTTRGAAGREPRPTIGHDTPISGGVYENAYGREAIVVDMEKHPLLRETLDEVVARITDEDGRVDKSRALHAVFDIVKDRMRYSKDATNEIFRTVGHNTHGSKIALDVYIDKGVGVCRHQALYAGAILEELIKRGILNGQVSVERNMKQRDNDDAYDGHAWVRYTTSSGEIVILDVAQNRVNTLDTLMRARRSGDRRVWDYGREQDHARLRGQIALEAAAAASALAKQPVGGAVIEYDKDGLIIVPDRLTNNAKGGNIPHTSTEGQMTAVEQFGQAYDDLLAQVKRSIDTAGHNDPCAMAGRIAATIEKIKLIGGVNGEMMSRLDRAHKLCLEINKSGRDNNSPYYRYPRSGLEEVYRQLTTRQ